MQNDVAGRKPPTLSDGARDAIVAHYSGAYAQSARATCNDARVPRVHFPPPPRAIAEFRQRAKDRAAVVTARSLETLIRLSSAHAKLKLRATVMPEDVAVAYSIMSFALYADASARSTEGPRSSFHGTGRAGAAEANQEKSDDGSDDGNDGAGGGGVPAVASATPPKSAQRQRPAPRSAAPTPGDAGKTRSKESAAKRRRVAQSSVRDDEEEELQLLDEASSDRHIHGGRDGSPASGSADSNASGINDSETLPKPGMKTTSLLHKAALTAIKSTLRRLWGSDGGGAVTERDVHAALAAATPPTTLSRSLLNALLRHLELEDIVMLRDGLVVSVNA